MIEKAGEIMKKIILRTVIIGMILIIVILLSSAMYTVAVNEFACVVRFEKIVETTSTAGLHFKIPFVDTVKIFPNTILIYDIPPSEVLTADQKNMTVDSYVLWEIAEPLIFFQALGTLQEAEVRLNAITYNALKNAMGTLDQNDIINQDDAAERNNIYKSITNDVITKAKEYGITVIDVKVKRFDLPTDNEQEVFNRMKSDREQEATKFTAEGQEEAAMIRNNTDKEVDITISNAEAEAAKLVAEGESEYMKMLAAAYDTDDKKTFYEFRLALEALKASLSGDEKVVILGKDSRLGQLLSNPE